MKNYKEILKHQETLDRSDLEKKPVWQKIPQDSKEFLHKKAQIYLEIYSDSSKHIFP